MSIDYDALFGSAEYDPCEVLKKLRPAYMKLITETSIARVSFRDRTVEYHRSDLKGLASLIAQMESECAAKTGGPRRRFAITAGSRYSRG